MQYNLDISEESARKLFRSQVMTEKEDVLKNVHWQIVATQEELENADMGKAPFFRMLIELLGRFEKKIDKSPFFSAPKDWWAYSFEISSSAIILYLEHYTSLTFDSERSIEDSQVDASFPLLEVKSPLLTVEEFAAKYEVLPVTVRQWIRRGKLRTAVKAGTEWRIPALTELPTRGYKEARYEWDEVLSGLPEEYAYIAEYNSAAFDRDPNSKEMFYIVFSDGERQMKLHCNTKGREQIELMLISNPLVKYVSDSFGIFA